MTPTGELTLTQEAVNTPLGLDPSAELVADATTLAQGSYLVMFTDGLTELHMADGELLGDEELGKKHITTLIRTHHSAAAAGAARRREPSAAMISAKLTALLDSMQGGDGQG